MMHIKRKKNSGKNLVIGVIGDESLHRYWADESYDLFLVYYGNDLPNKIKYKKEAKYYTEEKGTKFNIISKIYDKYKSIIDKYNYIFIPDDDIFISPQDINRLFKITEEYSLKISQPAIIGYYGITVTLPETYNILRYTNYVEIMCPCFRTEVFKKLHHTFDYNKSCWGIDLLWNLELGSPKDKLAIIDDVIALHTRPVYGGDNYLNNDVKNPYNDILDICNKYNINHNKKIYQRIKKQFWKEEKLFPNNSKIVEICEKIRENR